MPKADIVKLGDYSKKGILYSTGEERKTHTGLAESSSLH